MAALNKAIPQIKDASQFSKASEAPVLPPMFSRFRDDVARELVSSIRTDEPVLEGMLRYHLGWGDEDGKPLISPASQGKALRPTLCLFACQALGEGWQKALPAAVAIELIHNFSLIHDDIQDGDLERRHRPTLWALWGQPRAMVAGNTMRILADITYLNLVKQGVAKERALKGSALLVESYLEMIQGQCLDLSFERRMDIALEEYLTMISQKTGALMRCSMELGALLASDDEDVIAAFGRSGRLLGLAFQVQDDVLGIWGDEEATGKPTGNDIRRKKKSFPVVYGLQRANDRARNTLMSIYDKMRLDDGDVQQVLAILEETKARQHAQETLNEKAHLALREVESLPLPPWALQEMVDLVEFLTTRQY